MPSRSVTAFAPGRVNLIGEHTDYNGGLALPFAVEAGISVTAQGIEGRQTHASALDLRETDRFNAGAPEPGVAGWRALVRGVVAELRAEGIAVPAAQIEITGNLPRDTGLSSSAALGVALTLALVAISEAEPRTELETARLCQRVENRWLGAHTGLLDQLASLHGRPGHATLIEFDTLDLTPVPLELGTHRLVVMPSGERRENAASGYNRRREECEEAARRLGVSTLSEADGRDARRLPETLARRVRHVLSENDRVRQAVAALAAADMNALGRLLDGSHASLRDDYEVSTPALDWTVARLKQEGALGARLLGGGFGGSVFALLPPGVDPPVTGMVVVPSHGARLVSST